MALALGVYTIARYGRTTTNGDVPKFYMCNLAAANLLLLTFNTGAIAGLDLLLRRIATVRGAGLPKEAL